MLVFKEKPILYPLARAGIADMLYFYPSHFVLVRFFSLKTSILVGYTTR